MSASPQDLAARRATLGAFGDLVQAMRGVAAARAQRARALLAGVDRYADTLAATLRQARALLPPDEGAPGGAQPGPPAAGGADTVLTLVFGSEQGFSGGHSAQVLAAAGAALQGRVLILGSQTLRHARARGVRPEWSAPLPAHAEAAPEAAERLHAALAQALARQPAATAVDLVGAEVAATGSHWQIGTRRLLPPPADRDPPPAGPPPLLHLPPQALLDALVLEHVTAQLTRALLHAHAAEHLARLQAMGAASDNVQRLLTAVDDDERRQRQEAITAEIVELAAALRGR